MKEEQNALEALFSEIMRHVPNMEEDMYIQVQEVHRLPNRHDHKSSSLQHITVKFSKVKHEEKIQKCP